MNRETGPGEGAKTILLVEDEAIIALAEANFLKKQGYQVLTAYNGEAAILKAREEALDLILMDIDLGRDRMDGTEAARLILREQDIPVVFLSSHTEPEVVEKTEQITSYGYIVKNSGNTVLLASIKMAFRLFEAKQREKKSKDQLIHSSELMKYIIEHTRSAVAVHDRDLNYIYVSRQYLDQFKVKDLDIIGKHHYEIFPDLPQKWRDVHQQALRGEVLSAEDDPFERADGSLEWTRWECRPWYDADGSIGGIVRYSEVITQRKEAEEALRDNLTYLKSVIETTRDGFWVVNSRGEVTDANEAYCRMSGYSREELLGFTVQDLDALETPEETAQRIERITREGSDLFETRHSRKDGSLWDVELSISYLPGREKREGQFVCFCRDITESK